MKNFVNKNLADNKCKNTQCDNLPLDEYVAVDQWLKNFAVYAAVLGQDSPLGNGNNYYLAGDGSLNWQIVQYDHNNILEWGGLNLCDEVCTGERMVRWSITRPTCRNLEGNRLVGPLLHNEDNMKKYIEYVRIFTTTVMTDPALISELSAHAHALKPFVENDFWNFGKDYSDELSEDSVYPWHANMDLKSDVRRSLSTEQEKTSYPLLPTLKARAASIMEQLQDIADGSNPTNKVDWSPCQDWADRAPKV